MTTITATATPRNARTRPHRWRWNRTRDALTQAVRQGIQATSTARRRYRRPVLVVSSFAAIDAATWHTFGTGAGLAALGVLGLIFELLGGEE